MTQTREENAEIAQLVKDIWNPLVNKLAYVKPDRHHVPVHIKTGRTANKALYQMGGYHAYISYTQPNKIDRSKVRGERIIGILSAPFLDSAFPTLLFANSTWYTSTRLVIPNIDAVEESLLISQLVEFIKERGVVIRLDK